MTRLGFQPTIALETGISRTIPWYAEHLADLQRERLRPERGAGGKPGEAGPPSESERGWGPASINK